MLGKEVVCGMNEYNIREKEEANHRAKQHIGRRSRSMVVLSVDKDMTKSGSGTKRRYCDAMCDCGSVTRLDLRSITSGRAKWCCFCQVAENERVSRKASLNPRPHHKGSRYSRWKKLIYSKFDCKCAICGSSEDINAHHLNSRDIHPESVFDVDNGVVLCHDCHHIFHLEYGFGHNTAEQFNEWILQGIS